MSLKVSVLFPRELYLMWFKLNWNGKIQRTLNTHLLQNGMLSSRPWVTFPKLLAYFEKLSLLYFHCSGVYVILWQWDLEERKLESKHWKRQRVTWERKRRISGEIKVKTSLCEHSEMSAAQKMRSKADRLGRTWTWKYTHAGWLMQSLASQNMWTPMYMVRKEVRPMYVRKTWER